MPSETAAASPRGERGWAGLVIRVAVYFTLGIVAELLLAAWWRHIEEDDE